MAKDHNIREAVEWINAVQDPAGEPYPQRQLLRDDFLDDGWDF